MLEEVYFEPNPFEFNKSASSSTIGAGKPNDDFSITPITPSTIFYLAIIKPHTETYDILGPCTSFSALLPHIEEIVSNSPKAIDKLEAIRFISDVWGDKELNEEFAERGFGTFVVDGQRGDFRVLKVLREENREVREELPSPVYTITTVGPLTHKGNRGYVATTKLIGSFVDQTGAKEAAGKVMRELVRGEKGLKESEDWGKESKGGDLLMAMNAEHRWEVVVKYEDEVHKRRKEEGDRGGEDISWRL